LSQCYIVTKLSNAGTGGGIFARLNKPIDFAAIDGRPVDLVFLLLLPAEQLKALASVARKLRDAASLRDLRAAAGTAELRGNDRIDGSTSTLHAETTSCSKAQRVCCE
jgi:hypothetical protein